MEEIKQGYKQTDIGVIPADWEVKPIGKTLKIKHGKDQKTVLSIDGKYPILGTGGFMGYATKFLCNQDSVLIGRKGTINKPIFMDKPFWTVDTLFYSEIKKDYLPKFIFFKFQMIDWYAYNEASGVPSLNAKTIERIDISIPNNITEQTAIATALSDTDALIVALDKKIVKKQQIKQGAMQQLLTGKKRLPGFSGEWVEKKLGECFDKIVGGGTPSRSNSDYWNGTIPWATVKDFATFNANSTQEYITEEGLIRSSSNLIVKNIPITSTRMGLGKIVVYDVDVAINQDLKALYINRQVDQSYIVHWFTFSKEMIEGLGTGSTVKGIRLEQLKNIDIHLPNIKLEQTAIAQILTDMDNEIAQLEKERDKYKELKAGMMQMLLTGKIRLI